MGEVGCLKDGNFQNLQIEGTSAFGVGFGSKMKTVDITPTGDATVVAPTVTLTAADSGTVYFCNIASESAGFALPAVSGNAGVFYTFILNLASNAEGLKDLFVFTENDGVDILGPCLDAGAIHDNGNGTARVLQMDSSAGAAVAGNRMKIICDGTHWFVLEASAVTAATWVSSDAGADLV